MDSAAHTDLTLAAILSNPKLRTGFAEFCKVQHALENLSFYDAADTFAQLALVTVNAAASASETPPPGERASVRPGVMSRMFGRKTVVSTKPDGSVLSGKFEGFSLSSSSLEIEPNASIPTLDPVVLAEAKRVYSVFLTEGSPNWVCIDVAEAERIAAKLASPAGVDARLFLNARKQVFDNMEKDVSPGAAPLPESASIRY